MKKILFLSLIILMFSCEEKQSKTIVAQENKTIPTKENITTADSIKAPKPPVITPVKVSKIPDTIIKCFPPKSVECKDKGGDMENGFVTECIYANQDLSEAYNAFRERNKDNDDGKYLEAKIPVTKYIAKHNGYPNSVTYTYPKQNILEIELLFDGGVTNITFTQEKNLVNVIVNHSPD